MCYHIRQRTKLPHKTQQIDHSTDMQGFVFRVQVRQALFHAKERSRRQSLYCFSECDAGLCVGRVVGILAGMRVPYGEGDCISQIAMNIVTQELSAPVWNNCFRLF